MIIIHPFVLTTITTVKQFISLVPPADWGIAALLLGFGALAVVFWQFIVALVKGFLFAFLGSTAVIVALAYWENIELPLVLAITITLFLGLASGVVAIYKAYQKEFN